MRYRFLFHRHHNFLKLLEPHWGTLSEISLRSQSDDGSLFHEPLEVSGTTSTGPTTRAPRILLVIPRGVVVSTSIPGRCTIGRSMFRIDPYDWFLRWIFLQRLTLLLSRVDLNETCESTHWIPSEVTDTDTRAG